MLWLNPHSLYNVLRLVKGELYAGYKEPIVTTLQSNRVNETLEIGKQTDSQGAQF